MGRCGHEVWEKWDWWQGLCLRQKRTLGDRAAAMHREQVWLSWPQGDKGEVGWGAAGKSCLVG